ncbi:hypothetical protein SAMN04515617_110104 [Collimonas sp. OK242]|jgi:peptidoglycan/LPS O-acetylase OafA/YrhL|uniref:hypothetical protein n=1 Tax=Collimonas sp. OK242 TaxID=1798195 RepID=UPI00089833E0|nr:hypothetical protein [Collimonas sp. OK242]SDY13209.1 hypothetical protein SAMN04515617_110104 [Collimonas sp. OK242]
MKKLVLAMSFSVVVISPVMAMQENEARLDDVQQIFRTDSLPLELALLSHQEMKETEGAVFPVAVVGAIGGAAFSSAVYVAGNWGNLTWAGAGIAAGTGALIGSGGGALMAASGGGWAANIAWRPAMMAANYSLQIIGNGAIEKTRYRMYE